ncbi:hypothetical protein Dsin_030683 [Dipteronia sinensis]|uniref:VQ domain-containing protein n=1 Tax=Dipteronia sinensis TaxID=43782 RepID=A0AAD9ZK41_9ROSI|nr:hypothetical protein Dsin_030683 [Dipteronia sinensis]
MKISKNHHKQHHHHEKKQFNTLIKVLRPKVYITDSSTFKSLVQQLTGLNGAAAIDHNDRISSSSSSSPLPSPSASPPPETQLLDHDHNHNKVSIIDIDPDDDHYTDESNSCMEATTSSDLSVDSFHHEHITSSCNMQQPVAYTEEVKQLAYDDHDQMYYEYQLDHDHDIISEFLLMNQQHQHQHQQQEKGFWDNYDFESWLLGMEPCPNISYNGCYSQIQQEVSIYDYELPAVI